MKRPPLPRCACGKVLATDLDEARKFRAIIWAKLGGDIDIRYYRCGFESWHWTRQLERNAI